MKIRVHQVLLAALAAVLLVAGGDEPAQAVVDFNDSVHYPGTACTAYSDTSDDLLWDRWDGDYLNTETSTDVWVTCPILRPFTAASDADSVNVVAYIQDNNNDASTGEFTCYIWASGPQGAGATGDSDGTTSAETGNVNLSMTISLGTSGNERLFLRCIIPDNDVDYSSLFGYHATFS